MKLYGVRTSGGLYSEKKFIYEPKLTASRQEAEVLAKQINGKVAICDVREIKTNNLKDIILRYRSHDQDLFSKEVYENREKITIDASFNGEEILLHFKLNEKEIWWTYANFLPDIQEWCIEEGLYKIALAKYLEQMDENKEKAIKTFGDL